MATKTHPFVVLIQKLSSSHTYTCRPTHMRSEHSLSSMFQCACGILQVPKIPHPILILYIDKTYLSDSESVLHVLQKSVQMPVSIPCRQRIETFDLVGQSYSNHFTKALLKASRKARLVLFASTRSFHRGCPLNLQPTVNEAGCQVNHEAAIKTSQCTQSVFVCLLRLTQSKKSHSSLS